MMNINQKIESKTNDILFLEVKPNAKDLNLGYQVFEECFLKEYLIIKASKKLKILDFEIERHIIHFNHKQQMLSNQKFRLFNNVYYIEKKLSILRKPLFGKIDFLLIEKLELQLNKSLIRIDYIKNEMWKEAVLVDGVNLQSVLK